MKFFQNQTVAKVKAFGKKLLWLFFNPRLLLCLLLAWMITNGWAYILLAFGFLFDIGWMQILTGTYLGVLWVPFTPEKLLTVVIAIFLLRLFFPRDEKTLGVLKDVLDRLRHKRHERKRRRREKKQKKTSDRENSDPL